MKSTVARLRPLGTILFAAVLMAFGTNVSDSPAEAAGPGAGWPHQRPITLSAATPAASFQIRVQLTNLSNMAANGNDLRFYDSSGVQADYWIEYWNTNPVGQATVWVEVPTAGTSVLTMYYGNPSASAASSGDNTFIAFDDFSGTSINAAKWNAKDANASITVLGGSVTLTSGPAPAQGDQIIYKTPFIVGDGAIVESTMSSDVTCRCGGRTSLSGASTLSGTGTGDTWFTLDYPANSSYAVWSAGSNWAIGYSAIHDGDAAGSSPPVGVVKVIQVDGYIWPVNGQVLGTAFADGRVEYFQNYASSGSSTTNALSGSTPVFPILANYYAGTCGGTSSFSITTFRVRKFVSGYSPKVTQGATSLTVSKLADTNDGVCNTDCSLREAIATAAAGDIIVFHSSLSGGTITLSYFLGMLTLSKNVTIDGSALATPITIKGPGRDCTACFRVLTVNSSVTASLNGLTVRDGRAPGGAFSSGGGVFNDGTLTVTNCTFDDNDAQPGGGGGIYNMRSLDVINSTFVRNTAPQANNWGFGGGIRNNGTGAIATVTNSTFYDNSANQGGAIYSDGQSIQVTNSTFYGNSARTWGGAVAVGGQITLKNTIVANNSAPAPYANCRGTITNGGNNIDSGTTCGWGSTKGSMSNTNPQLSTLGDYGGPTQTIALLPGSPAIDGVTDLPPNGAPSKDQRGVARPQGLGYDIGAYELSDSTPPTASPTQSPAANGAGWNNSDVTVTWNWADNAGGSGVDPANCTASSVSSGEGSSLTLTATCKDKAGNTGSVSKTVKVDKTVPTISGSHLPAPNGVGWNNTDVTVAWTCNDTLSGLASGSPPADTVLGGEGDNLSAMGTCFDVAGNSASDTQTGIKIDKTAPNTSLTAPSGWNNVAVTLTLAPHDGLSGVTATYSKVDSGTTQSGTSIAISTEGIHTVEYWSEDAAGNVEAYRTAQVKIDLTSPTISHSQAPAANANGWNNSNVTVTFICADNLSGIASCTSSQTVTTEGKLQSVTGTAVDNASNTATDPATVSIDKTAPTISAAADRPANANGWYNADVLVVFTCADDRSGVDECPDPRTFGEGGGQSASGTVTDAAGNSASTTLEPINVDKTAPTASPSQLPAGVDGWNNTDVTVTWHWGDAAGGSGLDEDACTASTTSTGEGEITLTAACTDLAGNTGTASYTVHVDKTAPTASRSQLPAANSAGWNNTDVTVIWHWSDAACGSGIDEAACTTSTTSTGEGEITLTAACTDLAGNTGTASYTVLVDKTAPAIQATLSAAANDDGWFNADLTVTFSCDDGSGSGVSSCTDPVTLGEGANQSVTGTVTDLAGNGASTTVEGINVDTTPPTADINGGVAYQVNEGSSVAIAVTGDDNLSGVAAYAWDLDGDGTFEVNSANTTFSAAMLDGLSTVTVQARVTDLAGLSAVVHGTIQVLNVAPTITTITAPTAPISIDGQPFTGVSATYSDPGVPDTHTCSVNFDDGTGPQSGTASGGTCTGPDHTYSAPGVYTISVTVMDDDGGSVTGTASTYIVIYDPDGGFVTGGGWIMSPAGACQLTEACTGATGKANFGFVSKYQRGADVPTGNTEFQFKAGSLNFKSTSYEWLVVPGQDRAKYKGSGTINGTGSYTFMLTAVDNGEPGTNDTFRIKITGPGGGLVYDNKTGAPDDEYAGTVIGGGNIQVHKK